MVFLCLVAGEGYFLAGGFVLVVLDRLLVSILQQLIKATWYLSIKKHFQSC